MATGANSECEGTQALPSAQELVRRARRERGDQKHTSVRPLGIEVVTARGVLLLKRFAQEMLIFLHLQIACDGSVQCPCKRHMPTQAARAAYNTRTTNSVPSPGSALADRHTRELAHERERGMQGRSGD